LIRQFLEGAQWIPGLTVYGPKQAPAQVAVISLRLGDITPTELSQRLFDQGGLMTRSGLHCAPGVHRAIGTYPDGTTRFSFGCFNTSADIDQALSTLRTLAQPKARPSQRSTYCSVGT